MLLGWFDGDEDFHPDFWDKAEEIPGGFIIQREIQKAIRGESFFYNSEESYKPIRVFPVSMEEFNYYFTIWDDFHYLGLTPNGKGTLDERRWLLDLLKLFEKNHIEVNNFIENKNYEKSKKAD